MRAGLIVALWAVAAVLIMSIVALPISLQAHLVAGLTVVACMIILKFMRAQGIWRLIALAFGTAIVLRYVYWRTTSTLPPINRAGELHPGLPALSGRNVQRHDAVLSLFVVASAAAVAQGSARSTRRTLPTVDVFVPTYNEDAELLATTLAAAKAMDYPADKMTVWLLDDGGTDEKCNSSNTAAAAAGARTPRRAAGAVRRHST